MATIKEKKKKKTCDNCNKLILANKFKFHMENCKGKKRITCVKCNKSVLENNYKNHMERAHVNMIGKYDTSGVCHHCGEVSFLCSFISQNVFFFVYRKVTSSNTSCLETHVGIYRLLMKGIFDAYVL